MNSIQLDILLNRRESTRSDARELVRQLDTKTFVGIDFGTSTTTVTRLAYDARSGIFVSNPLAVTQEDEHGTIQKHHLVPTVIAYLRQSKKLLFGIGAKQLQLRTGSFIEDVNVWSGFKMRLGEKACYPRTLLPEIDRATNGVVLETPRDATALFFRFLRENIERSVKEERLPSEIAYAVTVPASFGPGQRQELCEAIRIAGLELSDDALLDEPNSAFLGSAAHFAEMGNNVGLTKPDAPVHAMVFDFGAGTCDITLLRVMSDFKIQNVAISKFTALGGRDIDRSLVEDSLFSQVVPKNVELPADLRNAVKDALRPYAEKLKIVICRHFEGVLNPTGKAEAETTPFHAGGFSFPTRDFGTLSSEDIHLSPAEFAKSFSRFLSQPLEAFEAGGKSIFEPVEDVLRKGRIDDNALDFVVLVGGSALNPFVREALKKRFGRFVQILHPGDIRTLVSRGAAIHSFAVNGIGRSFIAPITGESICIETAQGPVTVFPAGTSVPSDQKTVPDLFLDEDAGKGEYGIPFFADTPERRLGVARFRPGIRLRGLEVSLSCQLTASKSLLWSVSVAGEEKSGTFDMPQTLRDVPDKELQKIRAVNEMNFSALRNHGKPTEKSIRAAAEACKEAGRSDEAVDLYRSLMYEYRSTHVEDKISGCYREMGNAKEEYRWQKKAYEHDPSYLNTWYFIWAGQRLNGWQTDEAEALLKRAMARWPDDTDFRYVEARRLKGIGKRAEAKALQRKMIEEWREKDVADIDEYEISRFRETAEELGMHDLVEEIQEEEARRIVDEVFEPGQSKNSDFTRVSTKAGREVATRR